MASTTWATPPERPYGREAFVARTLELARDPSAWPILVHCHASMDRSPAWVGLYRFVIQGWPLADALRELEHHRGLRPKASVTLLYNRMLPLLAPERAATGPNRSLCCEKMPPGLWIPWQTAGSPIGIRHGGDGRRVNYIDGAMHSETPIISADAASSD